MDTTNLNNIAFDMPKNQSNVIKVIGVGGGGGNAINHMFRLGIKGVDFVICNTDSQALENSPVPTRIQLGVSLTEGLGAGANPDVGEKAAIESMEDIAAMLDTNTKMVFITAGMGGGTGTGAAPIVAKMAKEMGILTVGIVTSPFLFEGKLRNEQALIGIEKLRANVDSLIVINNNKLREVYGNLGFKAGFSKADEVLSTAAKGIAEVITHHYDQNIDLRDAKTVLSDSGTAIMGSASASGSNRAREAISKALDSPLLNDNKIKGADNVLLLIVSGAQEITIDEIGEINEFIQAEAGHSANIIMGVGEDSSKEDAISITIIATGFDVEQQNQITNTENKRIIHTLEIDQKVEKQLMPKGSATSVIDSPLPESSNNKETSAPIKHTLFDQVEEVKLAFKGFVRTSENLKNIEVSYNDVFADEVEETKEEEPDLIHLNVDDFVIISPDPEPTPIAEEPTSDLDEDSNDSRDLGGMLMFDMKAPTAADSQKESSQPVQASTQIKEPAVKRYVLKDEEEEENSFKALATTPKIEEEEEDLSLQFKVSEKPMEEVADVQYEELSDTIEADPTSAPISSVLKDRTEERKRSLKAFNYKFRDNNSNTSSIDKIEKEPAYKRQGVELSRNEEAGLSRVSLNTSDDEIEFRSNNSFLHDNVD